MVLTTVLSMIRYVSTSEDRDFVDRLHSYFTANMLVALSVLVSFKQFGGSPIECLTPDSFSGSWEEYAESYCFSQDTYVVPMDVVVDGMPKSERERREITYYQWVPFFLLLSAACFRLPSLIWRSLSDYSGIKIKEIIKMALDSGNVKPEIKKQNVKSISLHLQGALRFHRRLRKLNIEPAPVVAWFSPYSSAYVAIIYLTTKFVLLINVCAQLWLMNSFLQTSRYPLYGWGAVVDLIQGHNWERSGLFPRITLCDLQMRTMGNIQEFTIQCFLLINLLNEKVFITLWFWYAFLFIITMASFVYWFMLTVFPFMGKGFICRHLEMCDLQFDAEDDVKHLNSFVYRYLRTDGVFVIRTLIFRSGVVFATDLLADLYRSYVGIEGQLLKRGNSDGDLTMAQYDQSQHENRKNLVRQRKHKPRRQHHASKSLLGKAKNSDYEETDDDYDSDESDSKSANAPLPMPTFTPEILAQLQKLQHQIPHQNQMHTAPNNFDMAYYPGFHQPANFSASSSPRKSPIPKSVSRTVIRMDGEGEDFGSVVSSENTETRSTTKKNSPHINEKHEKGSTHGSKHESESNV